MSHELNMHYHLTCFSLICLCLKHLLILKIDELTPENPDVVVPTFDVFCPNKPGMPFPLLLQSHRLSVNSTYHDDQRFFLNQFCF